MDMFDRVANEVGGANIRVISGRRNPNGNQQASAPAKRLADSPKPLDIMSDEALSSLDDTLQKKFQKARDLNSRNAIQSQLYAIQAEAAKRQAVLDNKPVDVIPAKEKERVKGIGVNVGAGALIFGVLGFLVGATTTKPKSAMIWGLAGATMGGLAAFFMSQEDSGVKVVG
jgi:hypothetical protein